MIPREIRPQSWQNAVRLADPLWIHLPCLFGKQNAHCNPLLLLSFYDCITQKRGIFHTFCNFIFYNNQALFQIFVVYKAQRSLVIKTKSFLYTHMFLRYPIYTKVTQQRNGRHMGLQTFLTNAYLFVELSLIPSQTNSGDGNLLHPDYTRCGKIQDC